MEIMIDAVIRIGLVLATSFLFSIIFLAFLRLRNSKMMFISIGFGTFLVNALIHLPELFNPEYSIMFSENVFLLIHLIGLIFITAGLLKD